MGPESPAFSLRLAAHLLCRFQSIVRLLSPPPSLPLEEHQYSCINFKTAQKADSPLSAPRAFFFLGPSAGLAPQRVPGGAVNAALCAARQPQHPRPAPDRLRGQLTRRPRPPPRPRPPLAAWPAGGRAGPAPARERIRGCLRPTPATQDAAAGRFQERPPRTADVRTLRGTCSGLLGAGPGGWAWELGGSLKAPLG